MIAEISDDFDLKRIADSGQCFRWIRTGADCLNIAALGEPELRRCALGYRCAYVRAAAAAVLDGSLELERLKEADEAQTMAALTKLFGVGVKVASCVSLFGLHHLDAFPQDVWIKRILAQEYPNGYPFAAGAPFNGVYQQYMFAYYRALALR